MYSLSTIEIEDDTDGRDGDGVASTDVDAGEDCAATPAVDNPTNLWLSTTVRTVVGGVPALTHVARRCKSSDESEFLGRSMHEADPLRLIVRFGFGTVA